MLRKLKSTAAVAALAVAIATHATVAHAAFVFSGSFTKDNDVALFGFTVNSPTSVSISTSSFAGGGFDPILTLYDGNGAFLSNASAVGDATLVSGTLSPGVVYNVALTEFDNFSVGTNLSSGFFQASNPDFTRDNTGCINLSPACQGFFWTAQSGTVVQRAGNWQLSIDGADSAFLTPLPAALPLLGTALASLAVAGWYRRRNGSTT